MLSLTRDSQMDRAKETLRDLITYGDELIRDQRLRADLQAAVGHGVKAGDRVKTEIESDGITASLASDKKLRKHLRALLDNLDSASERVVRRKKSHRGRNVLLIIAGSSAVLAFVPNVRRRLSRRSQAAGAVMHDDLDIRYGEREAVPLT